MTRNGGDSAWETLGVFARVVRRRAWLVVLVAALVPLTAVYVSRMQDPVYEASAKVLVSQQDLAATLANVADPQSMTDPVRFLQTQARLARTTQVARTAVAALRPSTMTTGEFLNSSDVGAEIDSDLLVFSVRSGEPVTAVALANAYARAYTRYRNTLDTAPLQRALIAISNRLAALKRTGETQSALGASLLDKQQQLQTIEALKTDSATLVEPASVASAVKVKPQTAKTAKLALVLGLLMGVGLAFLLEGLDRRLRSPDDIPDRLQLPLLGRIPRLAKREDLPAMTQPSGPQADAYRMLRMNLEFATANSKVRTLMVTSAVEGEGKSTTAANLAVTLARAGRNVVLVDADFLRPSQAGLFSIAPVPGLVQVARRDIDLARALTTIRLPEVTTGRDAQAPSPARLALTSRPDRGQGPTERKANRSDVNGLLRLLTTEEAPLDSTETMVGGEFQRILSRLGTDADLVIVDAPPLGTSVTLGLSSLVDGVLVVANAELLRERTLDQLVASLEGLPGEIVGLVLTASDSSPHSGYAYSRPTQRQASASNAPAAANDRSS